MKVATGQFASSGDLAADAATVVRAIDLARGARVLVMPELFLGGYQLPPVVVDPADPRLADIERAAARAGLVAFVGACVRTDAGLAIATIEFGRGTRVVYAKQNPCDEEKDHVVAGTESVLVDVDGWAFGLSICYDGCFPEHARAVAVAGADVYLASVAYFTGSAHRRQVYYRARALENGMYAVVSGLTGQCAGATFDGGSEVYDPEGRVIAAIDGAAGEGVAVADLDRDLVAATRARHPMLADVRTPAPVVAR